MIVLAHSANHLNRLGGVIQPMREENVYDYVFLDCPPSLGVLMTSALAAADELLIPLQCEFFGLEGLAKINHAHEQIREFGANPAVRIEGIVMTMFDQRTNLSRQVADQVREHFPDEVYQSIIPRSIRLGEAPSFGQSIIEYDPTSSGASAYRALAQEFLARHREPAPVAPKADAPVAQIEGMAARLLSLLGAAPVAEDALIREMALPAASVSAILLDLELAGQVRRHPGAMISLI